MLSIGIDPSLTDTGIVIIEDGKVICSKDVKSGSEGKNVVKRIGRINEISKQINAIISENIGVKDTEQILVIEGYSFGSHGGMGISLGEAGGVFRTNLIKDFPKAIFIEVPPTRLKKFITGKGNCEKDLILKEVYKNFGYDTSNNNIADAFGLSLWGYALYCIKNKLPFNFNKKKLTTQQLEMIEESIKTSEKE